MPYICHDCREGRHKICSGFGCACLEGCAGTGEVKRPPITHVPTDEERGDSSEIAHTVEIRPIYEVIEHTPIFEPEHKPKVVKPAAKKMGRPNGRAGKKTQPKVAEPKAPVESELRLEGARAVLEGVKFNDRSDKRIFEIDDETRKLRQAGMANKRAGREVTYEQQMAIRRYSRARWAQLPPEQRKAEMDQSNARRAANEYQRRKAANRAVSDLRDLFRTEYQALYDMHLCKLMEENDDRDDDTDPDETEGPR